MMRGSSNFPSVRYMDRIRSKILNLPQQNISVKTSDVRKRIFLSKKTVEKPLKYGTQASPAQYPGQDSCVSYRDFFCTLSSQKLRVEANKSSSASYSDGFSRKQLSLRQYHTNAPTPEIIWWVGNIWQCNSRIRFAIIFQRYNAIKTYAYCKDRAFGGIFFLYMWWACISSHTSHSYGIRQWSSRYT